MTLRTMFLGIGAACLFLAQTVCAQEFGIIMVYTDTPSLSRDGDSSPVEVGTETMYEILVTNQGTEFAKGIRITARVPGDMMITNSTGPTVGRIDGSTIEFDSLARLAPRADAIYRVKVKGHRPGDFRIEVEATADALASPVTELESTKVYQD